MSEEDNSIPAMMVDELKEQTAMNNMTGLYKKEPKGKSYITYKDRRALLGIAYKGTVAELTSYMNNKQNSELSVKTIPLMKEISTDEALDDLPKVAGYSMLHLAALGNNKPVFQEILKIAGRKNKQFLDQKTNNGGSALHICAKANQGEMAQLLLDYGAHGHAVDNYGRLALHYAAKYGANTVVKILMTREAYNCNELDNKHRTPMHYAVCLNPETAKLMLNHVNSDFDPNLQDRQGVTVIQTVSETGNTGIAEILLQWGADPGIADLKGDSALEIAARQNHSKLVQLYLTKSPQSFNDFHCLNALEEAVQNDAGHMKQLLARSLIENAEKRLLYFISQREGYDAVIDACVDVSVRYADAVTQEIDCNIFYGPKQARNHFTTYPIYQLAERGGPSLSRPSVVIFLMKNWYQSKYFFKLISPNLIYNTLLIFQIALFVVFTMKVTGGFQQFSTNVMNMIQLFLAGFFILASILQMMAMKVYKYFIRPSFIADRHDRVYKGGPCGGSLVYFLKNFHRLIYWENLVDFAIYVYLLLNAIIELKQIEVDAEYSRIFFLLFSVLLLVQTLWSLRGVDFLDMGINILVLFKIMNILFGLLPVYGIIAVSFTAYFHSEALSQDIDGSPIQTYPESLLLSYIMMGIGLVGPVGTKLMARDFIQKVMIALYMTICIIVVLNFIVGRAVGDIADLLKNSEHSKLAEQLKVLVTIEFQLGKIHGVLSKLFPCGKGVVDADDVHELTDSITMTTQELKAHVGEIKGREMNYELRQIYSLNFPPNDSTSGGDFEESDDDNDAIMALKAHNIKKTDNLACVNC